MKIIEITKYLENKYPLDSQMSFDNSGACIVDFDCKLNGVLVCLDITLDTIKYATENGINLIISHHPLIFNDIKTINDDILSKRIKLLIRNRINAYSIHTNFDVNIKYGMGIALLNRLFKKNEYKSLNLLSEYIVNNKRYGIGNIIKLNSNVKFNDIVYRIKNKLDLSDEKISYYNFNDNIRKIVIIPGSGGGDIDLVIDKKPDLLITSDLKHNNIIDLQDNCISYFNATHYGLEKVFIEYLYSVIKKKFNGKVLTYYNKELN